MKLTTLFLCTLLAFSAFAVEEMDDAKAIETLEKINKSKFGKTILDTIHIQLQSGDKMDDLIELLKSIEAQLIGEQNAEDAAFSLVRQNCDNEITRLNTEIAAADNRVVELTDELNEKIPLRKEKIELQAAKEAEADGYIERVGELDEEKAERDQQWSEVAAEHDRATYIIESAKNFIDRGFGGAFLEKKDNSVFVQLSNHFAQSAEMKFNRKSWNMFFKILANIANAAPVQVNRDSINKIIALCDALLESIADSREVERRAYESWVAEYEETRANTIQLLEEAQAHITQLVAEISSLNKRISIAQDEREEQRDRSAQKNTELRERTQVCDDETDAYNRRRADRQADIDEVSECLGLVESKIRVLKQFVNQRLGF
jgi:chromosome segregation ATPase